MNFKRVVITGLGIVSPVGLNTTTTWANIVAGVSGSDLITLFDTTNFKVKFACEVKDFDPSNFFDRKEANKMDRFSQFALIASDEAIINANLDFDKFDRSRIGCVWASGIGGIKTITDEVKSYALSDKPRFSPFFIPKIISDIAAGQISIKHQLMGPNYCTTAACASSANSIIDACHFIQLGISDIIITGGSEAPITEMGVGGFQSMRALSENNEEYKTASRPFCATRDGFVLAEGACALVLEEYEFAKKRGAPILAEITGYGLSADAYHLVAPHPEGIGASLSMKNALASANISPEQIEYINVHGTSTPLGDVAELKAISSIFGENAFNINISSTKSILGHLLGAAGAIELASCVLSLRDNIVPPTINHKQWDESIDPRFNLTLHEAQKRNLKYAMSNTFGFGGHNATIIVSKID